MDVVLAPDRGTTTDSAHLRMHAGDVVVEAGLHVVVAAEGASRSVRVTIEVAT